VKQAPQAGIGKPETASPAVIPFLGCGHGVILHQPLSLQIFRKNAVFGRKMNGIPVCLCQKSENAPTWRPRKHNFRGPILAYFGPDTCTQDPTVPHTHHLNPTITPCLNPNPNVYLVCIQIHQPGKAAYPTHQLTNSYHNYNHGNKQGIVYGQIDECKVYMC